MPRPKKNCAIYSLPDITYYKPRGIPMHQLKETALSIEGFEAIRLADYLGMDQTQAAERMQISRATFGRILSQARQAIAYALVQGAALSIQGGNYEIHRRQSATSRTNPKKEKTMTKIAISSEGPTLEDTLDPRFGRAAGFIIYDTANGDHTYIENGLAQTMAQGAGIQTAENVINKGVEVVLTGYVGPKAFRVLEAAGVRIGQELENITIQAAIDLFKSDKVKWANAPNSKGHGR